MKTILVITTILTLSIGSCSQNKSERVKQTAIDRYCIVYKGEKFGIYDNVADSLVTDLKYDNLKYRRHVFENDTDIYIWTSYIDGTTGMLSIIGNSNETMEITLPQEK